METVYLKEYIAFTDSLNYAKAADDLFISQPALRAHVKALEDEVGAPFSAKRGNGFELTPAGKLFLMRARNLVALADEAIDECRALELNSTSLTVGTLGYPLFEEILGAARDTVRTRRSEAQVDLLFRYSTYANLTAVLERKVDMTLYPRIRSVHETDRPVDYGFPSEIDALYLNTEFVSFWVTKDNPLFEKRVITARDLEGQSLLLGNTDNMVSAGRKIVEHFNQVSVSVCVNHQPFASYADYMFSTPPDGFGMVVGALHPTFSTRRDFRMFTVEGVNLLADMLTIYNASTFDDIGRLYLDELAVLAERRESFHPPGV